MARDTQHALQPETDHDGTSRRLAVLAMKTAIRGPLQASVRDDFGKLDPAEARNGIRDCASYRLWSGFNRASQDRMWQVLAEQVDADYERIQHEAERLTSTARGSVETGIDVAVPSYQHQAAIHGQPGGYMLQREDDDLAAGVLYEAGGNLYAMGQGIGRKDSKGQRLIEHIRDRFPGFEPRRILELGCSAGGQTADYPAAFPGAECHAIDLSPGMLRYAHARTEALGERVEFHQRDAGDSRFADAYFDLIVSHNLFHEVAATHMPAIAAECFRILRPGGVCLHQDVPIQSGRFDAFMQFISDWQRDYNDEPFWMDFADADLPAMMREAGFRDDHVSAEYLKAIDGPIPWYVVTATRPEHR